MPRYKIHYEDGSEAGDASYAMHIKPGDVIHRCRHPESFASSIWCRSRRRNRRTSGY
jgi:hypothetical protein